MFVLTGQTKDALRKCYCWLCDIFYFFSNQYFSTALNFTFFIYSVFQFYSIYSSIVTVSPDTIRHGLFRSVLMLVITLQLSYTQETIYNALMNSNAKRKINYKNAHIHTQAHSKCIDSCWIKTLHTALQTEQRGNCHANVALLSSVHVVI